MSQTYTYQFNVPVSLFRKTQYFNTFLRKRGQGVFVVLVFVGALALLAANTLGGVQMSNVMQMCYIVCLIALPLCCFACEQATRRYRDDAADVAMRNVSVNDDWLKFRVSGNVDSEKLEWSQIMAVFETRDMFLIYRDADKYLALPKDVVGDDARGLRELFAEELGRSFHVRA